MPTLFTRGAASARGFGFGAAAAAVPYVPVIEPTIQGRMWAWGYYVFGVLGQGNTTSYSSPKQIGSDTTWAKIAPTRGLFCVAIKTNGTMWAWGYGGGGRLAQGNTTTYYLPKQIGALTTWSEASTSINHALALKTDGTLWSWALNGGGQLGLGNTTDYSSPKQVGALTNWLKIAARNGGSLAIKTNGTLWSWGGNGAGDCGLGNTTNYSSPKQVGALTTWATLAKGVGGGSLATKTNGTLWAWGDNSSGQLGLGNTTNYSSPKQVGALTTWSKVAGGFNGWTLAVKTDGTLWTWGTNGSGQLGHGNTTGYSSPKQVGALTGWSTVGAGDRHSVATKTNGTLWSWGLNDQGQLGLGNMTNYSSPKQIGTATTWAAAGGGYKMSLAIATI